LYYFFQKKRETKLKSDGQVNGVDPLGEVDDDRVKELARHFEEKYVSIVFVRNQTLPHYTVLSESCCTLRLLYVDLVVSIEVAVEVCCCFTVFSC
jgi:hypothetical protein